MIELKFKDGQNNFPPKRKGNNIYTKSVLDFVFSLIESNSKMVKNFCNSYSGELFWPLDDYNIDDIQSKKTKLLSKKSNFIDQIQNYYELLDEQEISKNNDFDKLFELAIKTNFFKTNIDFEYDFIVFKFIDFANKIKSANRNKTSKMIKLLKDKFTSYEIDWWDANIINHNESYDFNNYVLENELINVIGVTTSSRATIKVNSTERNLFSDYEIDYVLIDEISKSTTPEILSRAMLARRIIFVGDYRQLPPSNQIFDDALIRRIFDNLIKSDNYRDEVTSSEYTNFKIEYKNAVAVEENMTSDKTDKFDNSLSKKVLKNYHEWISDLFKESFFKIQTSNIIKSSSFNYTNSKSIIPYGFLNESHRFNGDIIEFVNFVYGLSENEKLIPKSSKSSNYKLQLNHFKYLENNVLLVDTSHIEKELLIDTYGIDNYEYIKKHLGDKSFDQQGDWKDLNNKNNLATSTFNQYSARVISLLVNEILKQNLKSFDTLNEYGEHPRIGVISLTKSQKTVINSYLDKYLNPKLRRFKKVDTIDNFQGREEDIIIVDFVRGEYKLTYDRHRDIYNVEKLKSRNTSFLKEYERINVAISRAKCKLILVGNFSNYLNNLPFVIDGNPMMLLGDYYDYVKNRSDLMINASDLLPLLEKGV